MSQSDSRRGTRGMSTLSTDSRGQSQVRAAGLVTVILTIVIAAAVAFIGVDVTSEIDDSIDVDKGSNFDHATNNVSSGFTDAVGLLDIVFIVLMFSVILTVLLSFMRMR